MNKLGLVVVGAMGVAALASACDDDVCFVAGTRVLTPKGPRAIEDLAPGDEVWSFDLARRETVLRKVVRVIRSLAPAVARLEAGEVQLAGVTASHPFWDATRSEFVRLDALSLGSRLLVWLGSGAAREVELGSVARVRGRQDVEVFNLEVDGAEHNYFAEGVLVHNKTILCTDASRCNLDGGGGQGPEGGGGAAEGGGGAAEGGGGAAEGGGGAAEGGGGAAEGGGGAAEGGGGAAEGGSGG